MKMTGKNGGRHIMTRMKLVLIGLALVAQGCVEESEPSEYRNVNREMALSDFEDALREASDNLGKLAKSGSLEFYPEKKLTFEGKYGDQKLKTILEPVITKSTNLLKTYGISESFIKQEIGDLNDPRLALIGLWIAEAERHSLQAQVVHRAQLADFSLFFKENTLTEVGPDWMECMMIAVGVDAIIEFAKGNVTKPIAKKAIRKIASRTLGWIGVGLALYEYGNCMNWY